MSNEMSLSDLGEMLGICYVYREMGNSKVQMDTAHAVEILERLLDHEQGVEE